MKKLKSVVEAILPQGETHVYWCLLGLLVVVIAEFIAYYQKVDTTSSLISYLMVVFSFLVWSYSLLLEFSLIRFGQHDNNVALLAIVIVFSGVICLEFLQETFFDIGPYKMLTVSLVIGFAVALFLFILGFFKGGHDAYLDKYAR